MSPVHAEKPVRVLLVEDSALMREFLAHVLNADRRIEVAGYVHDGAHAVEAARRLRPDVIAMDFHMPGMNGLEATRAIMEAHPTPIVIISGSPGRVEAASAFHLLEAGALAVVHKPPGFDSPNHAAAAKELTQTIKLMAEVKVVRRWARREAAKPGAKLPEPALLRAQVELVAIGASTGGPVVLRTILAGLPKDFRVPILIVQHIAAGFTEGMVEWLAQSSGFAVHLASDREVPMPGHAYIAPDGCHLKLAQDRRLALHAGAAENGHLPSVSSLFRSVADVLGARAVGILLTGMGKDGARELKLMRDCGAITIAQNLDSSIIHGMPGAAIALDAASQVLGPAEIALALAELVR